MTWVNKLINESIGVKQFTIDSVSDYSLNDEETEGGIEADSGELTIFENDNPVILDRLAWFQESYDEVIVRIYQKIDGDFKSRSLQLVDLDDLSKRDSRLRPDIIQSSVCEYINIDVFDETENEFGFYINQKIYCSEGLKITVENVSDADEIFVMVGDGREL